MYRVYFHFRGDPTLFSADIAADSPESAISKWNRNYGPLAYKDSVVVL